MSGKGSEFTATAVREWRGKLAAGTLCIELGSPWENGYGESVNGRVRDELLNRELFDTLQEARVLADRYRMHYNTVRPHSSLGYRPPALEATFVRAQMSEARQLPYAGTYDPGLT